MMRRSDRQLRGVAAVTRQGRRPENQDRVFTGRVSGNRLCVVVAVADGMGGLVGGAAAAEAAISAVRDGVGQMNPGEAANEWLSRVISEANGRVLEIASAAQTPGAGTTLTIAVVTTDRIVVGHVGDSRVYLWDAGDVRRLTRDHTVGEEAVESGHIPRERIHEYPYYYALTRSLGAGPTIEAEIMDVPLDAIDGEPTIIACTDGVWSVLDDAAWRSTLTEAGSAHDIASSIVDSAEQRNSDDNMAAVVVQYRELRDSPRSSRLMGWAAGGSLIAAAVTATYFVTDVGLRPPTAADGRTVWIRNTHLTTVAVRSGPHRLAELAPGGLQPLHVLSGDSLVFEVVGAPEPQVYVITLTRNTPDTIVIPSGVKEP